MSVQVFRLSSRFSHSLGTCSAQVCSVTVSPSCPRALHTSRWVFRATAVQELRGAVIPARRGAHSAGGAMCSALLLVDPGWGFPAHCRAQEPSWSCCTRHSLLQISTEYHPAILPSRVSLSYLEILQVLV